MKIVYNKVIPFEGFKCINLFGVLFVRDGLVMRNEDINHELIHTAQMRELLFAGFYILYVLEWIVRLLIPGKAYRSISFEREAYGNQNVADYLEYKRKHYQWSRYIFKTNIRNEANS